MHTRKQTTKTRRSLLGNKFRDDVPAGSGVITAL